MDENNKFSLIVDEGFNVALTMDWWILAIFGAIAVAIVMYRVASSLFGFGFGATFEIDETEFGLGEQKLTSM